MVDGAKREVASALRALGALGMLGYFVTSAARVMSLRAIDMRRRYTEINGASPLWQSRHTTVVPFFYTYLI